jgi:hypothetical protein
MTAEPGFWPAAICAVILLGLAKGGFAGLVIIGMSVLSLAISPLAAAALMLPILILQDVVSLWAYRKDVDRDALAILLPGAALGVALGAATAAWVSDAAVRILVGLVATAFAANFFLGFGPRLARSRWAAGRASGLFWGALSGFTSQVAHAGGPPFQVWILSRDLSRDRVVGVTAWYFAIVNLIKLPFFVGLGLMHHETLTAAAALAPLAVAATLSGVWLVRRTPADRFYGLIYALMFATGAKLIYDGAAVLLRSAAS